ncbi:hypothetical protein E2C01_047697 [Portunus trituberculatus]|uniref:Uncharacterized protein n=1 Tax=Portunus trituberculatus TaxID=210409 RepID=A0A5B7G8G4_PORTR|nr:hypothetical protein [Portunus trituberculatus]
MGPVSLTGRYQLEQAFLFAAEVSDPICCRIFITKELDTSLPEATTRIVPSSSYCTDLFLPDEGITTVSRKLSFAKNDTSKI